MWWFKSETVLTESDQFNDKRVLSKSKETKTRSGFFSLFLYSATSAVAFTLSHRSYGEIKSGD